MLSRLWRRNPEATPAPTPTPNRFVPRLEGCEDRLAPSTVHFTNSGSYGGGVTRYAVVVHAGDTVVANVKATNPGAPSDQQFDPIVGLFSPTGALLASNDDAGVGSRWAAKVTVTVPTAGTYTIGITHYSDFQVTGTATQATAHPGLDTGAFVLDVDVTSNAVRHWTVKNSTVHIPPGLESRIDQVADAYFARTRQNLVITDGVRTAYEQAQAIYTKLRSTLPGDGIAGVRALYANKPLINQIIAAYRSGGDRIARLTAMTTTIQNQVDHGLFVSRHLNGAGFDVRNTTMTLAQKNAFRTAVTAAGGHLIAEGGAQPHFHVQF